MTVPAIAPVDAADRPRWSVMIPAWNSAEFVAGTIESVLAAELPVGSQIEVVDDQSTDATAAIADRYANRGVSYFFQPAKQGASANFNSCIDRAHGHLVHILHSDDQVVPGFYTAMEHAFEASNAVAAFGRAQYIDESGKVLKSTRSEAASGVWPEALRTLAVSNRIRPPAIAVRRSAYEAVGGYHQDLHHAADWEMWVRLARYGPIWFEDRVLARYRVHEAQDTSEQIRNASNITERVAALELINQQLPAAQSSLRKGMLYTALFAGRTAWDLARERQWGAARAQLGAGIRCGAAGLVGAVAIARGGRSAP